MEYPNAMQYINSCAWTFIIAVRIRDADWNQHTPNGLMKQNTDPRWKIAREWNSVCTHNEHNDDNERRWRWRWWWRWWCWREGDGESAKAVITDWKQASRCTFMLRPILIVYVFNGALCKRQCSWICSSNYMADSLNNITLISLDNWNNINYRCKASAAIAAIAIIAAPNAPCFRFLLTCKSLIRCVFCARQINITFSWVNKSQHVENLIHCAWCSGRVGNALASIDPKKWNKRQFKSFCK